MYFNTTEYSRSRIIRTKVRENCVRIKQNVRIIHTSKSREKHTIMRITIVRIIRDVRISEGQIIRAIPYITEGNGSCVSIGFAEEKHVA